MTLLKELLSLSEDKFDALNKKADRLFGEFGIMSCDEEDMAKLIDIKKADKIAQSKYGEDGFATMDEDDARELINSNPTLIKK